MYSPVFAPSVPLVSIEFEGQSLQVPENITVAAAIFGYAREEDCRTSFVTGEERSGYCFMGVCHECLVEIDGRPNQQACATPVREGMRICKQHVMSAAR